MLEDANKHGEKLKEKLKEKLNNIVTKIINDSKFTNVLTTEIENTKEEYVDLKMNELITNYAYDNRIDINDVEISDVIKKFRNQLATVRAVASAFGGKKRKTNRNKKNKRKSRKLRRKSKRSN